jgi:hypothetical protein
VAKRSRYSRWRRLPGVYRFGEKKQPDPSLEPQRLTLYLTWRQLDAAEALAAEAGGMTIQEYCTGLLQRALDAERIRAQVANLEAQRGVLEGLHEIADDPEYLAEWQAQVEAQARDRGEPIRLEPPAGPAPAPVPVALPETGVVEEPGALPGSSPGEAERAATDPGAAAGSTEPALPASRLSPAAEVVLRHALPASEDGSSFLASLRRGEAAGVAAVAELARALHDLEKESREATQMDRRLVYALHRLAFEAQVLHTDAWPGAFDDWTVDTVRAVQEAVERILSGQDIRYYAPRWRPEDPS